VLGCGPHRKLGEPEPHSGLGFEVLRIKKIESKRRKIFTQLSKVSH